MWRNNMCLRNKPADWMLILGSGDLEDSLQTWGQTQYETAGNKTGIASHFLHGLKIQILIACNSGKHFPLYPCKMV